ncbi:MAG: hypothetical protein DMF95_29245, partial [Acidobacteria bacterium]
PTFREDFIPDVTPDKLEAGTYAYENVAGMEAAVRYLEHLGRDCLDRGADTQVRPYGLDHVGADPRVGPRPSRGEALRFAMTAIAAYEHMLSTRLLDAVAGLPRVTVHGVTDRERLGERVPTLCFSVAGLESAAVAGG